MRVQVNGESKDVPAGTTIARFLEESGLAGRRVAVERNGAVAARDDWPSTPLEDGDVVEIVHFVGGG